MKTNTPVRLDDNQLRLAGWEYRKIRADHPGGSETGYVCSSGGGYPHCDERLDLQGGSAVFRIDHHTECLHLACFIKSDVGKNCIVTDAEADEKDETEDGVSKALAPLAAVVSSLLTEDKKLSRLVGRLVRKEVTNLVPARVQIIPAEPSEVLTIDGAHEKLPRLIAYLAKGKHVYLWGPSGSGKSTGAKMAAEALSRRYAYISLTPQTPEYRVFGYKDANGKYVESELFDFYVNGGVYCIDEMDNASASLLVSLNTLLQNGHGAFACGNVKRHPNFVLVACGNTNGLGANRLYPERRKMDGAARGRLRFIEWGYDTKLERSVVTSINKEHTDELLVWAGKVREYLEARNIPDIILSPREVYDIADELKAGGSLDILAEEIIWKGFDRDTLNQLLKENPYPKALLK